MSDERQRAPLQRVGAIWKPRPGANSKGTGEVTIGNLKQSFVILVNDRKREGSPQPDYLLLSSDEPLVDEYAQPSSSSAPCRPAPAAPTYARGGATHRAPEPEPFDDDIPF